MKTEPNLFKNTIETCNPVVKTFMDTLVDFGYFEKIDDTYYTLDIAIFKILTTDFGWVEVEFYDGDFQGEFGNVCSFNGMQILTK
jgi:hypothetical protein